MPITENDSPYASIAARLTDIADLTSLQLLISLGANLTQSDVDAIDSITIRLLADARCRNDAHAVDRATRLRQAVRARFSPTSDSGH